MLLKDNEPGEVRASSGPRKYTNPEAPLGQGGNLVVTREQFEAYNKKIQPNQVFISHNGDKLYGASAEDQARFGFNTPEKPQKESNPLTLIRSAVDVVSHSKVMRAAAAFGFTLVSAAAAGLFIDHHSQGHTGVAEASGLTPDRNLFSIPDRIFHMDRNLLPTLPQSLKLGDVIRRVTPSGQQVEWTVLHRGHNLHPIINQVVPISYTDIPTAISDGTLMVNNYLNLPVINKHAEDYTFLLLTEPVISNTIAKCDPRSDCDWTVFGSTVDMAKAGGVSVDENEFMISGGATGSAIVTRNLDTRQDNKSPVAVRLPTGDPSSLAYTLNLATEKAHFYGIPDPVPGSDDDKNSLMGSGDGVRNPRWSGWQAALLEGELSSNNGNPSGRSAQPTQVLPYNTLNPSVSSRTLSAAGLKGMDMAAVIDPDESVTQMVVELLPYNNDGPAALSVIRATPDAIQADRDIGEIVREPVFGEGGYKVLPDESYYWHVSVSPLAGIGLAKGDPRWGHFETAKGYGFDEPEMVIYAGRTPKTDSTTITPLNLNGETTMNSTPTLHWANSRTNIFYYEVQLSGDPQFRTGEDATSFVYWNLVHGGETTPLDSWTVPVDAALAPGAYYWRVRPRVQGDGTPVAWSQTWHYTVAQDATAKKEVKEAEVLDKNGNVIAQTTYQASK